MKSELKCYQYLTTRAQREAIYRLFCRTDEAIFLQDYDDNGNHKRTWYRGPTSYQYRAFRKTVQQSFNDCLMVNLWGMWIGIERDGYTHS